MRLTRDHRLRRVSRRTRWSCDWEWCDAGALNPGDEVLIHNHRATPAWGDPARSAHDTAEGYLLGLLLGDGTLKKDKALLAVWTGQSCVNGGEERTGFPGSWPPRSALRASFHTVPISSGRSRCRDAANTG